jgi:threonine synthase
MRLVQEITKDPTLYLANSMNSLRVEGQKTVGIEIVQQFDWEAPDVIIIPGGNLGNVSALGKGLMMMKDLDLITKLPRIVVAQAERANPLYRAYLRNFESLEPMQAQKTLASAIQIGNPVSYENRRPRTNSPTPPRWAIGRGCSTVRTPVSAWRC